MKQFITEEDKMNRQDKNIIISSVLKEADVKSLTKVQQEILDACEPLIKNLQDQAEKWMDSVILRFEKEKEQETKEDWYKFVRNFSRSDDGVFELINSIYASKSIFESREVKSHLLDEKRKDFYYKREKENIKIYNTAKLSDALIRYVTPDFVDVKNIRLTGGTKGFEIHAVLTDNQNRQWNFETKAIGAGGYNIQIWHYRYIINLSSPEVSKDIVRKRVTEQEKLEKEKKQLERNKVKEDKLKIEKAKKIVSLFYVVRTKIKDWNEWVKSFLTQQVGEGKRSQQELTNEENKIDRLIKFNDKYNFKRQELSDKVLKGEITVSAFDEILDLIEDEYEYKAVKRL